MFLPEEPKARTLTSLMLTVFRANGRLLEKGDALVGPLNLNSARWQVLGALGLNGPLTAPQIAQAMGVTRQGAQKQLRSLLDEGYVARQHNPRHARSVLYALTDAGRSTLDAAMRAHAAWAHGLGETLTLEELSAALGVLERLHDLLQATPVPRAVAP